MLGEEEKKKGRGRRGDSVRRKKLQTFWQPASSSHSPSSLFLTFFLSVAVHKTSSSAIRATWPLGPWAAITLIITMRFHWRSPPLPAAIPPLSLRPCSQDWTKSKWSERPLLSPTPGRLLPTLIKVHHRIILQWTGASKLPRNILPISSCAQTCLYL